MRIKGIQFLHVAKLPNDYQTTKLERDHEKHGVEELELVEHGVMMNHHHLFPWSAIMRVDYFPNVPVPFHPMTKAHLENIVVHPIADPEDLEPASEEELAADVLTQMMPKVSLDPADNPLCDGMDPSDIALSVASSEPLSVDIPEALSVAAEVNQLESDLLARKRPKAPKKRAKRKPTT